MKRLSILLLAMALTACASFQQAVSGYESAAGVALNATNDNVVKAWTFQACATPFSTAVRHPEIVSALKALCLPAGTATTPGTLLDSVSAVKGVSPDGGAK